MNRLWRRFLGNTIFWYRVSKAERLQDQIHILEKDVEGTRMDITDLEHDIANDQILLNAMKEYMILIKNELDTLELQAQEVPY